MSVKPNGLWGEMWAKMILDGLYCPDCNMPMNECLCDVEGEDEG